MTRRTFVTVAVLCTAAAALTSAEEWEPRWRNRQAFQIRVARDYHLPAGRTAEWPIVIVGGSATIDGRVADDIVVIGGPLRVGPSAQIHGSLVAIGGRVQVADEADVTGSIEQITPSWPDVRFALDEWVSRFDEDWWAAFMVAGTLLRFTLTMIAACVLALVAPGWIRRVEGRTSDAPLASGFLGLASEILVVPAFVLTTAALVVTIVGIPLLALLPFAGVAFVIAWLAGFAGVAAQIGGRFRGSGESGWTIGDVAWGVALLFLPTIVGTLLALGPPATRPFATAFGLGGFVIEYLAWTVGLGAALASPFRQPWRVVPPPVPSAVSANA